MSRRAPNPAADRAAQNQATLKRLLKLEPNKVCADCKRNKHPRWASWNLGVFVCIRCSGIHRGMGTHISRVKSVDLDSWTEEQMASILSWGNARANKYWEAKLAPGHAPSESKIENFIRTKYELKRWVMDGPMPDPSTLDVEGDDDVPLNIVKEKQAIERKTSTRVTSSAAAPQQQRRQPAPIGDLIGGDDPIPQRSSTAGPAPGKLPPPKAEAAPPKQTNKDSLLGLDFLGESTAPPRPSSAASATTSGGQSRPDLKQSILSLYASAPRPQVQQQQSTASTGSFGSMGSPTAPTHQPQQASFSGFNDAFSNLSMNNTTSPKPAPADPFASFGSATRNRSPPLPSNNNAFGNLGGGSFFDTKPAQPVHQKKPSNSGFGDFGGFSQPAASTTSPLPSQSFSADLLSLDSAPPPQTVSSPPPTTTSPPASTSVFNLSSPQPKPAQISPPINPAPAPVATSSFAAPAISGADIWGGNAWGSDTVSTSSVAPAPAPAPAPAQTSTTLASNDFGGGWGAPSSSSFANTPIVPGTAGGFSPAPKVQADEEFGGWSSSTGQPGTGGNKAAAGAFSAADDDLFSNVWS